MHSDKQGDLVVTAQGPDPRKVRSRHHAGQSVNGSSEREIYQTIKTTYAYALEPELHAMIRQLRSGLPTVPPAERTALIDDIERSIGANIEEEWEY